MRLLSSLRHIIICRIANEEIEETTSRNLGKVRLVLFEM
jgi:hypothetical protein